MTMSYIYELHHAMLKINYIMPTDFVCQSVCTRLMNSTPYDMTNLDVEYVAKISKKYLDENENRIGSEFKEGISACSLDDLIEACRKWAIKYKKENEPSVVENLPKDDLEYRGPK